MSSDEVGRRRRGARTPAQPNPRHNAPPCTALPAKAVRVGCCRAPAAFRCLSSRPSRRGWSPHRLPLGQTMSMLPLACAPALCAPVAGNVKLACAAAGAAGSLPAPCRTQYMAADNPHPARPRRQLDTARQARMGCLSDLTASCPTPTQCTGGGAAQGFPPLRLLPQDRALRHILRCGWWWAARDASLWPARRGMFLFLSTVFFPHLLLLMLWCPPSSSQLPGAARRHCSRACSITHNRLGWVMRG